MFERAGFTEVARRYPSVSAAPRPIVRLELVSRSKAGIPPQPAPKRRGTARTQRE
jgi:hypothetical protein